MFFILTPHYIDKDDLRRDLTCYHRSLKLFHYINYSSNLTLESFTGSSGWGPGEEFILEPIRELIRRDVQGLENMQMLNEGDNLTGPGRRAVYKLKNNQNIVIKPADEGSQIVILDKTHRGTKTIKQCYAQSATPPVIAGQNLADDCEHLNRLI